MMIQPDEGKKPKMGMGIRLGAPEKGDMPEPEGDMEAEGDQEGDMPEVSSELLQKIGDLRALWADKGSSDKDIAHALLQAVRACAEED